VKKPVAPSSRLCILAAWSTGSEIDIRRSDAMNACPNLPSEILIASPLPQLRRLVVTVNEAEIVITGRVSSYYMKQLAQEALRQTVGDRRILNHVEVCPN